MRFPAILALLAGVAAAPVALADELPARKAGLWETNAPGVAGGPPMLVKQCIDAKTDALAQVAAAPGATCSKRDIRKTSAGYEVETSCLIGTIKAEGKGLISGDFVSLIKVDMTTTMSGVPGQATPTTSKMSIESKRSGDCGPGQSPGDIILPNGQVVKTPGTK